mmetsp:Transcript_10472/g.14671  ORF Transcript_10472/g.14671 Transcript_10472/m.14671 type:complete len:642 (-) Transcript_10472:250-2175(-)
MSSFFQLISESLTIMVSSSRSWWHQQQSQVDVPVFSSSPLSLTWNLCIGPYLLTVLFVISTYMFHRFVNINLSDAKIYLPSLDFERGKKRLHLTELVKNPNICWRTFPRSVPKRSLNDGEDRKCKTMLRRQMSSIGRFSLRSQTEHNPCIVTFFIAFSNRMGSEGMTMKEFEDLWRRKVMDRHERFRCHVSEDDDNYFEIADKKSFEEYASEVIHPCLAKSNELHNRVEYFLSSHLNVNHKLWEATLSTGPIGSSGAIEAAKANKLRSAGHDTETVALFRIHHALADGVSMSVALGDVADESDELKAVVQSEISRRKSKMKAMSFREKIVWYIHLFLFYSFGSVKALVLQFWRSMIAMNPFDQFIDVTTVPPGSRSTAWRTISTVNEVKQVTKTLSKKSTLNDAFVMCVTAAIHRQLQELKSEATPKQTEVGKINAHNMFHIPSRINVCIPVHLTGGVLLPGQKLGNKIGAFVTSVPLPVREGKEGKGKDRRGDECGSGSANHTIGKRLKQVSASLREGKSTPAPLIAWRCAKFFSDYAPDPIAKFAMRNGNAKSVAVISNIKGFPFEVHWNNRPVAFLSAFLPLPPGIPIGVCVQTYAGEVSFTIDADRRAVPDAEKFADWIMEEFNKMREAARLTKNEL